MEMEDLIVLGKLVSETRRWFALVDTYERILRDTEEKLKELSEIMVELGRLIGSSKEVEEVKQGVEGGVYAEGRDRKTEENGSYILS